MSDLALFLSSSDRFLSLSISFLASSFALASSSSFALANSFSKASFFLVSSSNLFVKSFIILSCSASFWAIAFNCSLSDLIKSSFSLILFSRAALASCNAFTSSSVSGICFLRFSRSVFCLSIVSVRPLICFSNSAILASSSDESKSLPPGAL